MAYDEGLVELLRDGLVDETGIVERRMFGGLAFMKGGHMVCGTYRDRAFFRVGKPNEAAALALPNTWRMAMGNRGMPGMVEADAEALGDDALRARLLALALGFVRELPPK